MVACDLARTELMRVVHRVVPDRVPKAWEVLDGVTPAHVTAATFESAGRLDPAGLRSGARPLCGETCHEESSGGCRNRRCNGRDADRSRQLEFGNEPTQRPFIENSDASGLLLAQPLPFGRMTDENSRGSEPSYAHYSTMPLWAKLALIAAVIAVGIIVAAIS